MKMTIDYSKNRIILAYSKAEETAYNSCFLELTGLEVSSQMDIADEPTKYRIRYQFATSDLKENGWQIAIEPKSCLTSFNNTIVIEVQRDLESHLSGITPEVIHSTLSWLQQHTSTMIARNEPAPASSAKKNP